MDMEAGLEHLGRATARSVDVMLIIVEPGTRSLDTAENIQRMAKELGIGKIFAVANKVSSDEEKKKIKERLDAMGLPLLATIPKNDGLVTADLNGTPVIDAPDIQPVISAVTKLKADLR
jgi:CO dehydrogenase maturation factor